MRIWCVVIALMWYGCAFAADVGAAATRFKQNYFEPKIVAVLGGWAGDDSAVTTPSVQRITDDISWTALWQRHAPGVEPPRIDFDRAMVVAVFTASVSASLYGIHLESAVATIGQIDVTTGVFFSDVVRQNTVNSYLFVVLPRSPKPIAVYRRMSGVMMPVSHCDTIGEIVGTR
jgi:hypothetical protein